MNDQPTYTQVIDEKTGEIKYVPNTPPEGKGKPGNDDDERTPYQREIEKDFDNLTEEVGIELDDKLTAIMRDLDANSKRLRYSRRLQDGKLDGRSLPNYRTSDKLFKRKAIKHRDYQFTILLDTSGSMMNDDDDGGKSKLEVATQSIIRIVNSLQEVKLPVCVVGMNNATHLLKGLDEEFNFETFMQRLKTNFTGSENGEGEEFYAGGTSEMVAYKETLAYLGRKGKPNAENVIFVLSDGEPGSGWDETPVMLDDDAERPVENGKENRRQLREFWERQPDNIRAYGLGIMSGANQIPRRKQINEIEELPTVMATLIEEILV